MASRTGFFNRPYLEQLIEGHTSGRRDYSALLWTLLMFEAFLRRVADVDDSAAIPEPPRQEAFAS